MEWKCNILLHAFIVERGAVRNAWKWGGRKCNGRVERGIYAIEYCMRSGEAEWDGRREQERRAKARDRGERNRTGRGRLLSGRLQSAAWGGGELPASQAMPSFQQKKGRKQGGAAANCQHRSRCRTFSKKREQTRGDDEGPAAHHAVELSKNLLRTGFAAPAGAARAEASACGERVSRPPQASTRTPSLPPPPSSREEIQQNIACERKGRSGEVVGRRREIIVTESVGRQTIGRQTVRGGETRAAATIWSRDCQGCQERSCRGRDPRGGNRQEQ